MVIKVVEGVGDGKNTRTRRESQGHQRGLGKREITFVDTFKGWGLDRERGGVVLVFALCLCRANLE